MTRNYLLIPLFGIAASLLAACEPAPPPAEAEADFSEFQAEQDQRQELEGGRRR